MTGSAPDYLTSKFKTSVGEKLETLTIATYSLIYIGE